MKEREGEVENVCEQFHEAERKGIKRHLFFVASNSARALCLQAESFEWPISPLFKGRQGRTARLRPGITRRIGAKCAI